MYTHTLQKKGKSMLKYIGLNPSLVFNSCHTRIY